MEPTNNQPVKCGHCQKEMLWPAFSSHISRFHSDISLHHAQAECGLCKTTVQHGSFKKHFVTCQLDKKKFQDDGQGTYQCISPKKKRVLSALEDLLEKEHQLLVDRNTELEAKIRSLETEAGEATKMIERLVDKVETLCAAEKVKNQRLETVLQKNDQLQTQAKAKNQRLETLLQKNDQLQTQTKALKNEMAVKIKEAKKMKFCRGCDASKPLDMYFCTTKCMHQFR